jgi:transcriptional regulator with XRE-family HTH domain
MLKATFSPEYETFLSLLKQSRLDQGLSQVELAERLGVNQSVVSKNERGERRMDVLELRDWCLAVRVPFPQFVAALDDKLKRGQKRR